MPYPEILDFSKIKTYSLSKKKAEVKIADIIDPEGMPCLIDTFEQVYQCHESILEARKNKAGVFFITGAHLIKSGGESILNQLFINNWFTQGLSNVATAIHSTELAYCGETSESVKENVKDGIFGCWDETGSIINRGISYGLGFGMGVGQMVWQHNYKYKENSIFYHCRRLNIPFSVLPSIGFDIIYCNNYWKGADIGRAGEIDFKLWVSGLYENLENGVIISVGSSVLGPQATEKAVSIVNNLRIQEGKLPITNFKIFIVDIQKNTWDWSKGEPPKDSPDYYNRICKSYSRLGGKVTYIQENNVSFLHNLLHMLKD